MVYTILEANLNTFKLLIVSLTIVENFIKTKKLELTFTDDHKLKFGFFYVFKKIQDNNDN